MISAWQDKSNFVSVTISSWTVWFSYATPVVVQHNGEKVATEQSYSVTTSRHITSTGAKKDQKRFDELISKLEKING